MIYDTLATIERYENIHPGFEQAIDFILSIDPAIACGKYEIDGGNIFATISEYNTKLPTDGKPELHKKYIDIQFLLAGEEAIGFAPADSTITESADYDSEKDLAFVDYDIDTVKITTDTFAMFFPEEIHFPGLQLNGTSAVKKVVVKILL